MKILYVYGDDYSALEFKQKMTIQEGVAIALSDEPIVDEGGFYAEFKLYEFSDVDEKFIEFVKNEIMDYDEMKHSNFYIVEE